MAVHLAVAGDVLDGVLFCAVLFPHEMSWMKSGTESSQFLIIFLSTVAVVCFHERHVYKSYTHSDIVKMEKKSTLTDSELVFDL